jgi:hypothetical protein
MNNPRKQDAAAPTTTGGEWTAAIVSKLIDEVSLRGVADAHNKQLAAAVEALKKIKAATLPTGDLHEVAATALAKLKAK